MRKIGTVSYANGEIVYKGEIKGEGISKVPHGIGRIYYKDGRYFEGSVRNGEKCGYGVFKNAKGVIEYAGYYKRDKFHGFGTYYFPDGTKYEGYFKNGYKHGQGKLTYSAAVTEKTRQLWYKGSFRADKITGKGELHYNDGSSYVGGFLDGKSHGKGIAYPSDEEKKCKMYYSKTVFRSRYGKPYGKKKIYTNKGAVIVCDVNSDIISYGEITFPSGTRYEGQLLNNKPHGRGTLYYSTGRGEGEFVNGTSHGKITIYSDDGSVVKCTFVNGQPDGKIVTTFPDGRKYIEYYKNGKKIG